MAEFPIYKAWSAWLENLESAQIFIDATLYFTAAAALERRVWMTGSSPADDDAIFFNCFNLHVGPPAAGKSRAMRKSWSVLKEVKDSAGNRKFSRAAGSTTPAALVRSLSESRKEFHGIGPGMPSLTAPYSYYYMIAHAEELGNLIKAGDRDMPNVLCQFFDSFEFDKKTISADTFDLENISVSTIACCTPSWIKDSFNEAMFGQGFMSRFNLLYADGPRFIRDVVDPVPEQLDAKKVVVEHLTKLSQLYGRVTFTPAAVDYRKHVIEHPTENLLVKRFSNSKYMEYYYNRKRLAWFKLAGGMHFSESTSLVIDRPVMERAYAFLEAAERVAHKAFEGLAKNENFEFYQQVEDFVKRHSGGVSRRLICKEFDRDLDKRQMDDVLSSLFESGRLKRSGDLYLA